MLKGIITIAANIIYIIVLNLQIYTDRTLMPNGSYREWKRSPISRLHLADQDWMFYLQIILSAVSVISGILVMTGMKKDIIRRIWLICLIGATVMFVIIMIVTCNANAKYA